MFAGAGFSRWAGGLPLAHELFDFVIEPFGVREEKRLRHVKEAKAAWDRRNPHRLAEAFIADALSLGGTTAAAVRWYVVRRLSEPYIWEERHAGRSRRHVLMIDEDRKWRRPGVTEAAAFLTRQLGTRLAGVVTTNYDLLIEYALGSSGFNYGVVGERLGGRGPYPVSQWTTPVTLKGKLPLAKVHGSISWDEAGRYTDGRRGLTGTAMIVAPGLGKKLQPRLARDWDLAAAILKSTGALLVFGFAFNPYDHVLLEHLRLHRAPAAR